MRKRIFILAIFILFKTSIMSEAQNSCNEIEQIRSTYKPYLVKNDFNFIAPNSMIEFYKENISTHDKDVFTISPIIITDSGKKVIGNIRWFAEDNAIIDTIFTIDLNGDRKNELVFILKSKGYLRECSSLGNVLEVFALSGSDYRCNADSCFIENYPLINSYFSVIRTVNISGIDSCKEKFCTKKLIVNEIIKLSKMPTYQFFSIAYNFALESFKGKLITDAANISSVALIYPTLLSDSTVNMFNDMGFFKEQKKEYLSAIRILKPIVDKFPSRTVAYLNLADAYWGIDNKASAKEAYQTYANLMKKDGKMKKIPQRVFVREPNRERLPFSSKLYDWNNNHFCEGSP